MHLLLSLLFDVTNNVSYLLASQCNWKYSSSGVVDSDANDDVYVAADDDGNCVGAAV